MEHRFGRRHDVQLTTRIHLDPPPLVAQTRNISRHGLNLPLTHPDLEPNRMVDVMLSDSDEEWRWQTRALVIHSSPWKGTGLVLAQDLPEDFYRSVTGTASLPAPALTGHRRQG